jgi:ceramide glucosyltransferase
MDALALLAAAFAAFALLVHFASALIAGLRCRVPRRPSLEAGPPVTIIRPVCGLDQHEEATLRSTFALDHPQVEILFCCSSRADPVVALVERLIAEHPHVRARLLTGDTRISQNPKLNNIVKGWHAAAHGWIAIVDSNVLMPPDFLRRLFGRWGRDTGLVSAPPIGCRPEGAWAELECSLLNGYQARWQYAADSVGFGFAQGKVLFWRRTDLQAAGGIDALAGELAEDAASTKVVRGLGLRVRLADGAFRQPLGRRTAQQVWDRQLRWARLRRVTFPGWFALEPLSGLLLPLAAAVFAAQALDVDAPAVAALFTLLWLAAEASLTAAVDWHMSWRSPLLWLLRELLLPVLWVKAWAGNGLSWRGNEMSLDHHRGDGLRPRLGSP